MYAVAVPHCGDAHARRFAACRSRTARRNSCRRSAGRARPLALDLRVLVRERLQAGDSDRQVIDFLVSRYGEFVLLKPRFSLHTALLWLGPLAVLVIGAFGLFVLARRHRPAAGATSAAAATLTPAEEARLSEILDRPDR